MEALDRLMKHVGILLAWVGVGGEGRVVPRGGSGEGRQGEGTEK